MKTFRLLTTILLPSIVLILSELNAQSTLSNAACTVTIAGPTLVCANDSFDLVANVSMGTNPMYSWSPGNEITASIKDAISMMQTYTVTVNVDGGMSCTASKTVNVSNLPPSVGGSVAPNQTICSGTAPTELSLTGYVGSIARWESSTDGGSSWVPISNITDKHTPGTLTQTTKFRAVVKNTPCNDAFSSAATITVVPQSMGGTVITNQTICSGTAPNQLSLTSYFGSIVRWEFSTNGGTNWAPISNTTDKHSPGNLTQTTQFRAVVKSGACPEAFSSAATITVDPQSIGGTVASSHEICIGKAATQLSLSGHTGSVVRWESSIDAGMNWIPIVNTSLNYPPGNLTQTTRFRAVVKSGSCPEAFSVPAIVTVNPLPIANAGADATICGGDSKILNATANGGTPGYNFSWSDTFGNPHPVSPPSTITYTVTVTDSKGCTDTDDIIVTVTAPQNPMASTTKPSICLGDSAPLTASTTSPGTMKYAWSPASSLSASNIQNPIATPAATTTYVVTITDMGNNCFTTASVTVTVNNLPTATASTFPANGFYCNGDPIQLNSGGGVTYAWSGPNSFTSNTQNPTLNSAASNMAGTYTVVVTSPQNQGGCTASATVQVTVNPPLSVTISSNPNTPICPGDPVVLTAVPSGGTSPYGSFNWGPNIPATNPVTVNPIAASPAYSVTIKDSKNCPATGGTTIAFKPAITFSPNGPTQDGPYCEGATIKLHANAIGATSYSWSGPSASGPIPAVSDPSIPLSATTAMSGIYTVTASDNSKCAGIATVAVNVYSEPVINVNAVGDYCAGSTLTLMASYTPTSMQVPNPTFVWRKKLTNGNYTPVGGNSPSYQVINIQETTTYQVVISFPTNTNCNTDTAEVVVTVISDPIVTIDGPKTVCTNQQAIYYVAGNPADEYFNQSDFIWSVGGGATIVDYFQGSSAVVIKWGSSDGTISVKQTITSPGGKTCDFFGQYAVDVTSSLARPADSIGYYAPNNILICKDTGATCYQWGYYDRLTNKMVTLTEETYQAFGVGSDYKPDIDYWVKTWKAANCNDDSSGCATVSFFRTEIYNSPTDLPKILLYPNPNNGSFKLEVNLLPAAEYELHIIDPLGRTLHTIPIQVGPDGILAENIQLPSLANGLYFATLRQNSAVFLTRALSIQH